MSADPVAQSLSSSQTRIDSQSVKSSAVTRCTRCRDCRHIRTPRHPIPLECPIGLSTAMSQDAQARRRWLAYVSSLDLAVPDFGDMLETIWAMLQVSCEGLTGC